ncbi:MAG: hypothetical protein JJT81_13275 [Rubellimicrobium sp.]|nr:hypothetical protein [Rubellimicrobium sp.]
MADVDKLDDAAREEVGETGPTLAVLDLSAEGSTWLGGQAGGEAPRVDGQVPLTDLDAARAFLTSTPDSHVLLLVPHPVHDLARALDGGQPLNEAIATSVARAREALAFLHTDQRRILMADRDAAARAPDVLAAAVMKARRIELRVPEGVDPPGEVPKGYQAFALHCFAEDTDLRRLLGEVETVLLPVGRNDRNRSDWEDGVVELARLRAEAARARPLPEIEQQYAALRHDFEVVAQVETTLARQNLALLQALAVVEAERDKLRAQLVPLKEKFATAKERLGARTALLATLKTDLRDAKNKAAGMKDDLLRSQAEIVEKDRRLGAQGQRLARVRAERDAFRLQASELEGRIMALEQSTSWRITTPLRAMRLTRRRSGTD